MHAYIKSSGFIGGKGPRPLKKFPFCQTMVILDYMCVQSFVITHRQCFILIVKYKVISQTMVVLCIQVNEKSCRLRMGAYSDGVKRKRDKIGMGL